MSKHVNICLRNYVLSSDYALLIILNILFLTIDNKSPQEILETEKDREELKSALIKTQESAALQILLEVCIPTPAEKKVEENVLFSKVG